MPPAPIRPTVAHYSVALFTGSMLGESVSLPVLKRPGYTEADLRREAIASLAALSNYDFAEAAKLVSAQYVTLERGMIDLRSKSRIPEGYEPPVRIETVGPHTAPAKLPGDIEAITHINYPKRSPMRDYNMVHQEKEPSPTTDDQRAAEASLLEFLRYARSPQEKDFGDFLEYDLVGHWDAFLWPTIKKLTFIALYDKQTRIRLSLVTRKDGSVYSETMTRRALAKRADAYFRFLYMAVVRRAKKQARHYRIKLE